MIGEILASCCLRAALHSVSPISGFGARCSRRTRCVTVTSCGDARRGRAGWRHIGLSGSINPPDTERHPKGISIMKKGRIGPLTVAAFLATCACAEEGSVPQGIPRLDHVFVIMMENHGYSQVVNNPNAPFINQYVRTANLAINYFAIGHPSLTNYLEIVGGSNFGVLTDSDPAWHDAHCATNLSTGLVATET